RAHPAQAAQPSNPFSRFYNAIAGDYVLLRSSTCFTLSRWDILLGFGAFLIGACVCFIFAFLGLPWLSIHPAKFALAFSLSVLVGPINHIKHLVSKERLPFSAVYLSSLALTHLLALGASSRSIVHSMIYLRPC
ncbi:hypothetical protein V8E55_009592, partial [Tylopilus felleus]